MFLIGQAA